MVLKNHIAYRFLTDDTLLMEIIDTVHPGKARAILDDKLNDTDEMAKVYSMMQLLSKDSQKAFYVTETVIDKLEMLHTKRMDNGQWDWRVFRHLKDIKYTFILPPAKGRSGGSCLRMKVDNDTIEFCDLGYQFDKNSKEHGQAYWVMFYVNKINNFECDHFKHADVKAIDEFVYKLLCFVFLSENSEEIIKPGEKKGTRKQGKIINTLPVPLTIINSKWNITSIRTDGFAVRGHFAIRWTGENRSVAKMVWINPFEKHGYIRKAPATEKLVNVTVS